LSAYDIAVPTFDDEDRDVEWPLITVTAWWSIRPDVIEKTTKAPGGWGMARLLGTDVLDMIKDQKGSIKKRSDAISDGLVRHTCVAV
jgi:hypothetical protein